MKNVMAGIWSRNSYRIFCPDSLTGRVYAQSYWNVFGLAAQQIDNNFLNYAIMSPNVAVASVLMAVGTICIVSMFRNQLPDLIGNKDPQTS